MVSPGTFVHAGEERADHDRRRARGDGFGDVTGILDAAVGDDWNLALPGGAEALGDGGDLRHAGAGDHAGGADGARTDADLDRVRTCIHQGNGALIRGDVADQQIGLREALLHRRTASRTRARSDRARSRWRVRLRGYLISSAARSRKSPVAPMAAPTRRRPCASLAALGYLSFFWMSLTVIRPFSS